MISLMIEPGSIKAMQTRFTKNGHVEVLLGNSIRSRLFDDIIQHDVDLTDLKDFFIQIRKEYGSKEDYYIVLPDCAFITLDIFEWEKEGEIGNRIRNKLDRNLNDLYYSCPIVCAVKGQTKKSTAAVIEKHIIDNLAQAAKEARLRLVSVEPSSIAFLRTKENFSPEMMILESYYDYGSIIAYSGVSGAFSVNRPDLASKRLDVDTDPEKVNLDLYNAIVFIDQVAEDVYDNNYNVGVAYAVFTDNPKITKVERMQQRLLKDIHWPEIVSYSKVDGKIVQWLPLLGTVLQNAPVKELVFRKKPSFLTFKSSNLLPAVAINQAKALQIKDKALQGIKYGILALFLVLVAELGMFLYFSSVAVPKDLQADYDAAYQSSGDINREIELLNMANRDDAGAIRGFSELLKSKPQDIGFIKIEIANSSNNTNQPWINLSAAAADPVKFQDYLATLSMNPVFAGPAISKINSDSKGIKVADFTVQRGGSSK